MEDLETFVAVVEHGSFTAAAHALGITVTVVSRRKRLSGHTIHISVIAAQQK